MRIVQATVRDLDLLLRLAERTHAAYMALETPDSHRKAQRLYQSLG